MLEQLGATPDEVAQTLRAHGIKGVRNTARFLNPIVRYALSELPDGYAADLTLGNKLRTGFASEVMTELEVPKPVLEFLHRFHEGQYPDLEMPTQS